MLRLFLLPFTVALLTGCAGCSDDPHSRILAAPPPANAAPAPVVVAPAPPPSALPAPPSPVEEHDDTELDRFVVSPNEILAAVQNNGSDWEHDVLYVARTTDGGRTWTRTRLDLSDPHVWYAHFSSDGTKLHVEMFHGMSSTYDFMFATRDRGVTWKRLPGGGFQMKPPPKITSSSSSSRS